MTAYIIFYVVYDSFFIIICCVDEGVSFITFVRKSLYPKGNNASKDEGLYNILYVALFLTHSIWEQVPNSNQGQGKYKASQYLCFN